MPQHGGATTLSVPSIMLQYALQTSITPYFRLGTVHPGLESGSSCRQALALQHSANFERREFFDIPMYT